MKNSQETLNLIKSNNNRNSVWVGPVQGAEHLDLVKRSAGLLDEMGYEMMALGSPVQLLESYEFAILADMIATLKTTVMSKPIHLFGAGHPLTIPLAVALGVILLILHHTCCMQEIAGTSSKWNFKIG